MAAVASRSSLVGALLRNSVPSNRPLVLDLLRGLSRDELECLAEFQGACVLEQEFSEACHPYRLMLAFFDPETCERWRHSDYRAHRINIVLDYLERVQATVTLRVVTPL